MKKGASAGTDCPWDRFEMTLIKVSNPKSSP